MQLRSGRRLVSPPPVPQGGARRCRRRRCQGGDGDVDGEGEGRISGLPEELRLEVLRRVGLRSARDAVRTGVLSRDWRGLWTGLRDLTFDGVDPGMVEGALGQVRSEQLDRLEINFFGGRLAAARITSLLRAADRLDPAELVVWLKKDSSDGGPFELPCFKRAISIELLVKTLQFTLPPSGNFASLEKLELWSLTVNIGVLLPRCPLLRRLSVYYWHQLPRRVTIRSKSLEELKLSFLYHNHDWPDVNIVAPELKKFKLHSSSSKEFSLWLSAPKVEEFYLEYTCQRSRVGFGEIWRLWSLKMETDCSKRDGHRSRVCVLSLTILGYHRHQSATATRSFAQEITRLPVSDFSILELELRTEGHVLGPLVLQLLRIRTAIQQLKVVLREIMVKDHLENCDCDEDGNWKNEQISLPYLEVVEIQGFGVAGHEVDFIELLFRSAPMLKKMNIALSRKVSSKKKRRRKLQSLFEANASVECSVLRTT
ncbi:hypothetical protein ACP70R_022993 [Stipagrostis hirtigluma subsp. patula]